MEWRIRLTVNQQTYSLWTHPHRRLLDVLRDDLQLMGTKEGCGEGECGACTIILNQELVNACLIPVAQAHGGQMETIEGLARGEKLHPLQEIFLEQGAVQCGYCTPGIILAALHLLRKNPKPSRQDIQVGLSGNLCRCTGYQKIVAAVQMAAERLGDDKW